MQRVVRSVYLCDGFFFGTMLMAAVGCGGPANKYAGVVTGTVTVEGELAKSGTVAFHPSAKDGKIAVGRIYPDGSFSLRTGQGNLQKSDGGTVVPGEYIVTISVRGESERKTMGEGGPPLPGPSLIAAKYSRQETSPLKYTVKEGGNVATFELERIKPGEEPTQEEPTQEESVEHVSTEGNESAQPPAAAALEEPNGTSPGETKKEKSP